jgi:competence ComEA-like helix-hairpin-helix protein
MSREPRAVLVLLLLAVVGHGARLLLQPKASAPGGLLLPDSAAQLDPARQRAQAARAVRPLGAGERIDVNTAPAEELARLPRVGMSLAKRIVADRAARGPYRRLADLDRVPGVGPSLLSALGERVRFGGVPAADADPARSDANPSTSGAYPSGSQAASPSPVNLNLASEAELVALPGIGRARARAILAYRRENGPFAVLSDLGRVPGFSHALVRRLTPYLVVR